MQDDPQRDSSKSREDVTSSSDTRKRDFRESTVGKQSQFKRVRLGRNRRVRVSPEVIGEAEPIYLEDFTDDPEYYIMRRPKIRRPLPRHNAIDDEDMQINQPESGTVVSNAVNNNYYLFSRRSGASEKTDQQPIGTSRGPGIQRGGSLRERSLFPDHLVGDYRSVSEAEIRDIKLEDIEDVNVTTEVKQPLPRDQSDDEYIPRRSSQSILPPRIEVISPQSTSNDNHNRMHNVDESNLPYKSGKNGNSSSSSSSSSSRSSNSIGSKNSTKTEPHDDKVPSKTSDLPGSVSSFERKLFDRSPSEGSNIDMGLLDGVVTRSGPNSALDSYGINETNDEVSRSEENNGMWQVIPHNRLLIVWGLEKSIQE
uniref:Uncharacterized protein n=1 Tax=Tetranychus urticae TaxID=32264 RepID=T1KF32_TETUR